MGDSNGLTTQNLWMLFVWFFFVFLCLFYTLVTLSVAVFQRWNPPAIEDPEPYREEPDDAA